MSKRMLALAFAAGLLGGAASRFLTPAVTRADSWPREVRAQRFVLINDQGTVLGTFAAEADGKMVRLLDSRGREIWSAGGSIAVPSAMLGK
jgi:hypothetical protein